MDEKEYQEIIRKAERGEVLIGVEPALARQFFTASVSAQKIQEIVGEPLYFERYLVKTVWLLEPIFLFLNFIASIFLFKWYSVIIIPIIFAVLFLLISFASAGKQRIIFPMILLIIGFLTIYHFKGQSIWFKIWIVSMVATYFFAKLTYWLSVSLARLLACRNYKFFYQFLDKIIFLKEQTYERKN